MSLWIGEALGPVAAHAHHAIRIALALAGGVRFQLSGAQPTGLIARAVIASDRAHMLDGMATTVALIFMEPESQPCRALQALCGETGLQIAQQAAVCQCGPSCGCASGNTCGCGSACTPAR